MCVYVYTYMRIHVEKYSYILKDFQMICVYRCVLFYRTCLLMVQIRKQKKKKTSKEFFDPFCGKFPFKVASSFAGIRNLIEHVQNQTKE